MEMLEFLEARGERQESLQYFKKKVWDEEAEGAKAVLFDVFIRYALHLWNLQTHQIKIPVKQCAP